MSDNFVVGAEGEVYADQESNRVIARFRNPATGEIDVELRLPRNVATSFAFALTTSAYELPE